MSDVIDLRSKIRHFRILVIGRANAGKTTLLKKVCNSIEDPEIYDPQGEKTDPSIVEETVERGLHDIENQLIFKSNPQFIFHDSRGFESGSTDETEKVSSFITKRAGATELKDQLHAIWYCLPVDNDRPILVADENFFNEIGSGKVPVLAIFTKFDGLVSLVYQEIKARTNNREKAANEKVGEAKQILEVNLIGPLKNTKFNPSDYVQLDDMRNKKSSCAELIEKTANALDDDVLRLLFVSVQQNNINLCIRNAMNSIIQSNLDKPLKDEGNVKEIVKKCLAWFPHVWKFTKYDNTGVAFMEEEMKFFMEGIMVASMMERFEMGVMRETFHNNVQKCTVTVLPAIFLFKISPKHELAIAICVCTVHIFQEAHAQSSHFAKAFDAAFKAYLKSSANDDIVKEIECLLDDRDNLDNCHQELCNIVIKHPLCINAQ